MAFDFNSGTKLSTTTAPTNVPTTSPAGGFNFSSGTQVQPPTGGGLWSKIGGAIKGAGNFIANQLPAVGGIVGGIAGGIIGTPADIVSGPAGTTVGAITGATLGGSLGESLKQDIQGKPSAAGIVNQGAIQGATEAIAGPTTKILGKATEATGEVLGKMFIPKSTTEAAALQSYKAGSSLFERAFSALGFGDKTAPGSAAQSAFNKGLMGTESMIGVQAKRAQGAIWNKIIGPALKQVTEKVDIPAFFKDTEDSIIKDNVDPTRQKSLLTALSKVKNDFAKIGSISYEQLQKFKEGWAKFVPESSYKGKDITGALAEVRNVLAGNARQKIYTALGDNVKQAYLDYGNLEGIKALGQKAMTGVSNIIQGGTGTSIKNLFERATIPIGTIGGQVIYKVGQGIEMLGPAGAKVVADIVGNPPSQSSGSSSNTSPQQTSTPPVATQ